MDTARPKQTRRLRVVLVVLLSLCAACIFWATFTVATVVELSHDNSSVVGKRVRHQLAPEPEVIEAWAVTKQYLVVVHTHDNPYNRHCVTYYAPSGQVVAQLISDWRFDPAVAAGVFLRNGAAAVTPELHEHPHTHRAQTESAPWLCPPPWTALKARTLLKEAQSLLE